MAYAQNTLMDFILPSQTEILALAALGGAIGLLIALSAIDLKHGILPDKLVLAFLGAGMAFHYATHFLFISPLEILEGAALGGGLLYAVRVVANFYYKDDVLGLGDVKLLAAAGAWLGPHDVIIAIMVGAAAGIVHGLSVGFKDSIIKKKYIDLKTLSLPAGPGFAVGIAIAGVIKFWSLVGILNP